MDKLKAKWAELSPKQQLAATGLAGFILGLILGLML